MHAQFVSVASASLVLAAAINHTKRKRLPSGPSPIKRIQKTVNGMFLELGRLYIRRSYQMDEAAFWKLYSLLECHMKDVIAQRPKKQLSKPKKKAGRQRRRKQKSGNKDGASNGIISLALHLSAALRYFARGSPYDISLSHGMSHTKVYESVWIVIDAVNKCDALSFSFPKDHDKQHQVAASFQKKSRADFGSYAGCIVGMLLWMDKPHRNDCFVSNVGSGRFFCGRKKKFGLCFQGVCDAEC